MDHGLPDEETTLKFYTFQFAGIEEPVIIEEFTRRRARNVLMQVLTRMPVEYGLSKVLSETVTTPVYGVSNRIINKLNYIWVGKNNTATGWMEEQEFIKKEQERLQQK